MPKRGEAGLDEAAERFTPGLTRKLCFKHAKGVVWSIQATTNNKV